MVLADVAFVSAEMVFYDKKSDFSAGIQRYKPLGPWQDRTWSGLAKYYIENKLN